MHVDGKWFKMQHFKESAVWKIAIKLLNHKFSLLLVKT